MPWLKPTETQARLLIGALKGARPGGLAGGAATVLSGVAVITTTPAWLPVIGGAAVVSVATVVTGTAIGAGVGAIGGAVAAYIKKRRIDKQFDLTFNPSKKR